MALHDSKGKDAKLLECVDKETMLGLICMLNEGLFIDWEHGSCDFMGGEFRKSLEFADCFPAEKDYGDSSASEAEAYFNGIQNADKTAGIVQNCVQTYLNERLILFAFNCSYHI